MAREVQPANSYRDVLLKLIPSEIVAAYMVIDGAVSQDEDRARGLTLIAGLLLLLLTPIYLARLYGVRNRAQIIFTTLSFVVWLYSLGGPFRFWGLYYPAISSVILVIWTLLAPLIVTESLEVTKSGAKEGEGKEAVGEGPLKAGSSV